MNGTLPIHNMHKKKNTVILSEAKDPSCLSSACRSRLYFRTCLAFVIALSFLLAASTALAATTNPDAASKPPHSRQSSSTAVATDRFFEFHSGFWINMHLFLVEEALTRRGGRTIGREAEFTNDSTISATLSGTDKAAWDAAIASYQENIINYDLVTSDRMRLLKNTLENFENENTLRLSNLDPKLIHVLDEAAPVYRAHWWDAHDRANRAWISDVSALADADGSFLTQKMAAAYETPWPDGTTRVDVVAYANDSGGFTTLRPTRITVSSLDPANQKLTAEEALFHEGSHALAERVGNLMLGDFAEHKKTMPPDLLHAILYFTAGYFVKLQHPDYIPYAQGNDLWIQPRWKGFHDAIVKDWQPHLKGQYDARAAIAQLVTDVIAANK
ncbi:MAG TPA: hypothetical protein VIY69_10410 [Candidatus Acidoferrales bacterium]